MGDAAPELVGWLRAAGEATRLRLLALCAERDLSVSDLAAAVRQSEPRVSRHLKILSEAGLIARVRQGQWVHYQIARTGPAAGFVQGLLAQIDRADPILTRDRERLRSETAPARQVAADSRLGRALQAFVLAGRGDTAPASVLVVGLDHLELLAGAAAARQCTAIAQSRRAAQLARVHAEREGLKCRVLLAGSDSLSERDLTRAGAPFEEIVLDRFAASGAGLPDRLTVARQALAPGGRLVLFERYEALENSRSRVVEHPLARLRRLLSEAGFACEKLSPIEADGEHVLAAAATAATKSDARVA